MKEKGEGKREKGKGKREKGKGKREREKGNFMYKWQKMLGSNFYYFVTCYVGKN